MEGVTEIFEVVEDDGCGSPRVIARFATRVVADAACARHPDRMYLSVRRVTVYRTTEAWLQAQVHETATRARAKLTPEEFAALAATLGDDV
jgi:hypothetical protein